MVITDGAATKRLGRLYTPIFSSFQIEVYAIRDALSEMIEVYHPYGRSVNVFTDSQSTLSHLRSLSLNPRPVSKAASDLVRVIDRCVRRYDLAISFYWIPGHVGIRLNEEADRLAKSQLKTSVAGEANYVTIPRTRLRRINREITGLEFAKYLRKEVRDSHWSTYPPRRFYKKQRSSQVNISRQLDVCLFRLRTGHNKLKAHLANIGIEDSAVCRLCAPRNSKEDIYHLMVQCRQILYLEGGNNIRDWRQHLEADDRATFYKWLLSEKATDSNIIPHVLRILDTQFIEV